MFPESSLLRSAAIQTRVIHALVMREIITRYGRHNIGFLWLFIEPMLFTLGVTTLWVLTKASHGSTLPIVEFAVTGYSSVIVWRNSSSRCVKAVEPNLSLLYHRNVTVLDVYFARLLLEIVGASVSFVALTAFFSAIGWMRSPQDVLLVLSGWGMLCWFGVSLGLVIGSLSEKSEFVDRIWHIITYLMFPLSGVAFLVEWLPPAAQKFILWLPMVNGIEMLRAGYFGSLIRPHFDAAYLASFNAVTMMLGLVFARQVRQHAQPE